MNNFDFIAIGDIATDEFIRLEDAEIIADKNGDPRLSISFRDKVPFAFAKTVAGVGNSANAAVSAARLGLTSALLSNIGSDDIGKGMLESLAQNGVNTSLVKIHEGKKSNHHYVLWFQEDRTILINHEQYDYELPGIGTPKWLYLSSVAANAQDFEDRIAEYLRANPSVNLAFQPGTYQIRTDVSKLKGLYETCEIFFCNREEAQRIVKTENDDVAFLLDAMHNLGPTIVIITDGMNGCYARLGGDRKVFLPAFPDLKPPLERTGAGDAFASTVTAALAMGKPIEEALLMGPVNSMSVVQHIGAQEGLLSTIQIEEYLKKAPKEYVLRDL